MRFIATLRDSHAINSFTKALNVMNKICKQCLVRITPTDFSFLRINSAAAQKSIRKIEIYAKISTGLYNYDQQCTWLEIKLISNELFSSYRMAGVDAAHNEIYFTLLVTHLLQSVITSDNFVQLKLAKIDETAHLKVELRNVNITHDIPVEIMPVRRWNDFSPPNIGTPSVSIYLPTLKTVQKMVSSIKTMGAKHIEIRANAKGELKIDAVLDQAKINVYINDLSNLTTTATLGTTSSNNNDAPFYVVRLSVKEFHNFFNWIPQMFNKVLMKIIDNKIINFIINEADCQITFYMGGLYLE